MCDMTTVGARLGAIVAADPTRPLLTWYDDGNGERTELSGATLANWVAKTADLLGCWSAGIEVVTTPGPAQVGFATPDRAGELTQPLRYLVGLQGLGLPLRHVPEGYLDFTVEVRGFGDRFTPVVQLESQQDLLDTATERAADLVIEPGDRVLIDAARYPDPMNWLLAPLAVGASIVLCGHLNPEEIWERVGAERVTRNLAG